MSWTARRVRARRAVALVVASTLAEVSGYPDTGLFAVEDFRYAAVVQASLGGYLSRRKTCLPRSLEAFAARGAGLVSLTLSPIERSLETPHLSSGLLLSGIHDCRSLRAVAAPTRPKRRKATNCRRRCDQNVTTMPRNALESLGRPRNVIRPASRAFGSTKGKGRHLPALLPMRPTRIELATFGLKDRRSLVPVKGPLTTELRAPCSFTLSA